MYRKFAKPTLLELPVCPDKSHSLVRLETLEPSVEHVVLKQNVVDQYDNMALVCRGYPQMAIIIKGKQ
jgi:hypothetical protein